jgi:nicotinamidase-related amidase
MNTSSEPTAMIAVDVQDDFLPGGALAVRDGDEVIAPLVALARTADLVVATRDFHPAAHCSFAAQGGPWPPHCVIGTAGALITPAIDAIAELIVSKGMDPNVEAYSGFDGTGLACILHGLGIVSVLIGGLATDYCVRATALAAQRAGFVTTVVTDAIRPVDVKPGDGERALEAMREAGVTFTTAAALR